MTAADLAVIVVTHNSETVIDRALDALGPLARTAGLVVDNASTDGTVGGATAAGVRVIRQPANLGYAAACNLAARAVEARVVCFLNPDCIATAALLRDGLSAVVSDPTACVVPVLVEGGREVAGRQPGYSWLTIAAETLSCGYGRAVVGWMQVLPGFHDPGWTWPHGACWFVDRQRFLDLGGLDERFFTYMEDVDFGRRWQAAGGSVYQLDRRVSHLGQQGARVPAARRRALIVEARLRYARVHHGRAFAALLGGVVAPGLWARRVLRSA